MAWARSEELEHDGDRRGTVDKDKFMCGKRWAKRPAVGTQSLLKQAIANSEAIRARRVGVYLVALSTRRTKEAARKLKATAELDGAGRRRRLYARSVWVWIARFGRGFSCPSPVVARV